MKQWKNYVAFYRGLRGHTVETQRKLVEAYVRQRGGKIMASYEAGEFGGGERDDWIKSTRINEAAIVAGLFVIPEMAAKWLSPSADFAKALAQLNDRKTGAGIVVCAQTGITSEDGVEWANLIETQVMRAAKGRQKTRKEFQKMARLSHENRPQAIKAFWHSPAMAEQFRIYQNWYRSTSYKTAEDAIAAMPKDVRESLGSLVTAIKVFGPRFPDGSKGGRRAKKRPKHR